MNLYTVFCRAIANLSNISWWLKLNKVFETANWVYAKTFHILYKDENSFLTQKIWLMFGELEGSLTICVLGERVCSRHFFEKKIIE